MNSFFRSVGPFVIVLLVVNFVGHLCYDLAHPEMWGDWEHNPWLSLGVAVVVVPLAVHLARKELRVRRQMKRNARLCSLIVIVKGLFQCGRRREAEEAYELYRRIKAATTEAEEAMLAKQFLDLYGL